MISMRMSLLARAIINWETGCWEWSGERDRDGYGRFRHKRAHRLAYELLERPIPAGLTLDHLCRIRHCINPAHLEPVTAVENTRRSPFRIWTINASKTHCKSGHEFTPQNTYMRPNGRRGCRPCNAAAAARYKLRKQEAERAA